MKKILITGSREGYSREDVSKILQEWNKPNEVEFIHGGAPGVDTYAKDFADVYEIKETTVRPKDPTKKKDYIIRNFKMVDMCDIVLAFWDGKSPGTKSTIDYAKKVGRNLIEYRNLDPEQLTLGQHQRNEK